MKVCHAGRGLHGQAHCNDGCLICCLMKLGRAMLECLDGQVQSSKGSFHQFWLGQLSAVIEECRSCSMNQATCINNE